MISRWFFLSFVYIISFTNANPTNFTIESRYIPAHFFSPVITPSLAGRCFGCLVPSSDCTVPCSSPQRCFIRGPTPFYQVTDRRCTDERWVNDLLVDGCLTYNGQYWCMCSTDLCNSGDFNSIRGFDDCSRNPCPSGTVCLDTKEGFSCICPPWKGDCTYAFSVGCSCKNGGRCIMGLGSYICECPYGYNGLNCETKMNNTEAFVERFRRQSSSPSYSCSNRCQQRTCTYRQSGSGLAPSSCTCGPPSHYTSRTSSCNIQRAPQPYVVCKPNPCQHGQTCQSLTSSSFFCTCQMTYIGPLCERSNPCAYNPCSTGQRCVISRERTATCVCNTPYCQRRDACLPNPCQNGGSCIFDEPTGSFRCYCPPGYTGRTCDSRPNPCASNPCQNNGICTSSGTSFVCSCPTGYSGQRCETRDPCATNPCMNAGQCRSNGMGGFTCVCVQPYTGSRCEDRIDPCNSQPCRNGGTCRPVNGNSYQCICPYGYSGYDCSTRDPCAQNPCLNGGQCLSNNIGGFTCQCPFGYSGPRCEDRDPCAQNPCLNGGQCISNNVGGFTCQCPAGFSGSRCEDQDGCGSQPCQNRGVCVGSGGSAYICQCRSGFEGPNCEQIDICGVKNPCICGTCQNDLYDPQGFRCFCPPGYSGNRCEKLLSCVDSGEECTNGGRCVQRPLGDYICSCPYPYCGLRCQFQRPSCGGTANTVLPSVTTTSSTSTCSANLCNNRGICQQVGYGTGMQCYCSAGWSGSRCQYSLSCKDNQQCSNGGVCREVTDDISICHCPAQFWGERCEYTYESWSQSEHNEPEQQEYVHEYDDAYPSSTNVIKRNALVKKTKKRKQINKN